MIAFFRSILASKLVMGLFALIMLAFVVTGVGTGSGGIENLAGGGNRIAKIGSQSIDVPEAAKTVNSQFDAARQQQPGLDIAGFVKSGNVDQILEQMINSRALDEFGQQHGIVASDRLVDGEIASIPSFRGATGKFDRNIFLGVLSQRKMSESGLRADIARSKVAQMLIIPAGGAARVPAGLVSPYASLLLETRVGQVAAVPVSAIASGPEPTQPELQQFYSRNTARYTVPETRVIRFATFDRTRFEAQGKPSEAELAAAYKAKAEEFTGKETRILTQVVLPDQAAANALAAKVRSGTAIIMAAKAAGTEATTLAPQDKTGYASLSSSAVAVASFAAKQGDVIAPTKAALGWYVVRIDKVNVVAGKSLADVRDTLAADVSKNKIERLLADFVTSIDDEVADGATFDDIVKKYGLAVVTTPPVTGGGIAPADAAYKATVDVSAVLKDAFQAEADDDPAVITVTPGQSFAFYDLDRINSATPRPLPTISAQVSADFKADRAGRAAKKLAEAIAAKVQRGTPLGQAMAGAGVPLPAPRPINAKRLDLVQMQGKVPAPLAFLFSMARGTAKGLESPDKTAWLIIDLEQIVPGNAAAQPDLLTATAQQMGQVVGEEYVSQFANAIKADVGVKRNGDAVARFKSSLTGAGSK